MPRRSRLVTLAAVLAGLAAPAPAAAAAEVPDRCVYERPCVFVSPGVDPGKAKRGTVLRFRGRGWRPRTVVEAGYGAYCPPGAGVCPAIGYVTRLRADRKGRFSFAFRYGRRPPRVKGPKAAGDGEVRFLGRGRSGKLVERTAVPPPPASTKRERREAARVRAAVDGLSRDLERASDRTFATAQAQQEAKGRCEDILEIQRPRRRHDVIWAVFDASVAEATHGEAGPELARFAARLEALRLTDPVLAAGVAAWVRAIRAPRYVPEPDVCTVLERWRDTGYDPAAEPVDPATTTTLDQDIGRDHPAIDAAARRLRDLGVRRVDVDQFAGGVIGLEVYLGQV